MTELIKIAGEIGLDESAFGQCLKSGKYAQQVTDNLQSGIKLGIQGTPYAALVKDGKIIDAIPGAYPYEEVKKAIDKALGISS